ncbi:MAG: type VI secretion system tip protein VgrG [Myxococcales bacterium]|nr:type VI secretion system tip protein VgrG [Myxococcales bacterium]
MQARHHLLALAFASGPSSLSVRRFAVGEALSELFLVDVVALSDDPSLDLEELCGREASFRLTSGHPSAPARMWSGLVSHAELLHAEVPGAGTRGASSYLVRIVPALHLTTQRREHRIFQQKTVREIVAAVLGEWKLPAVWRLEREAACYPKLDYVVQYGETDYDFVRRLCERWGITFFFAHGEDATELVFADQPHLGDGRPGLPIPCFDEPPQVLPPEYACEVRSARRVRPGSVTLRDYEMRRSYDFPLFGKQSLPKARGATPHHEDFLEQYRYEPGGFLVDAGERAEPRTPVADDRAMKPRHLAAQGERFATSALAAARTGAATVSLRHNCPDLAPGVRFALAGHPRPELGERDGKPGLLVTRSFLEGSAEGAWRFGAEAAFTDTPYVPPAVTPKPRITGMQSAVVVGPRGPGAPAVVGPRGTGSPELHPDEHGRVRVQFHWDREGRHDDKSSAWLRVSEAWAGSGYGTMMLPRVGQEVLVAFYEGDPDQPVVVGRVYNELNMPPYALPEQATRTTWRSYSTPQKDGFNELTFDDDAGKEWLYLQAERDYSKLVKKYETERTGKDRIAIVGGNRESLVKALDATMVAERYLVEMMPPGDERSLRIVPEQGAPELAGQPPTLEMRTERVIFTTGRATLAIDGANVRLDATGHVTVRALGADLVLEGKKVKVNSGTPAAPPTPEAFGPLAPGTESPQAKRLDAAFATPRARAAAGVALATPRPEWAPGGEVGERPPCELVRAEVRCQHDRKPYEGAVDARDPARAEAFVLEVVPRAGTALAASDDVITLKSQVRASCGQHSAWSIAGPEPSECGEKKGDSHSFPAKGWKLGLLGKYTMVKELWGRRTARSYNLYVRACSGKTFNYTVRTYPSDKLEYKWPDAPGLELAQKSGPLAALGTWVETLLTRAGAGTRAGKLPTLGAKDPVTGVEVTVELCKGQLVLAGEWTEWPQDWRAYWKWSCVVDFDPLLGLKLHVPVTPHLPAPFSYLGDAYVFVELYAELGAKGGAERKSPDTRWQAKPVFEVKGSAGLKVGGHLHLVSKDVLEIEAYGQVSASITGSYLDRGPLEPPALDFVGNVGELVAVLEVKYWANWWKPWKWYSGENGTKKLKEEWKIFEGYTWPLGIWELGSAGSDKLGS